LTFDDGTQKRPIFLFPGTKKFSIESEGTKDGQILVLTEIIEARKKGTYQSRKREGYWGKLVQVGGESCPSKGNATYILMKGKWEATKTEK
jgi:hypothetical protein